jgi:molecular chaperone GrpE
MSDSSKEFEHKEEAGISEEAEKQNQNFMANVETSDQETGSPNSNPGKDQTADANARLAEMQAELNKYKDAALRAAADLDNYRKRVSRERDESIKYANAGFLERLIPVLDNFELGLQAARNAPEAAAIVDGLSMVYKQLHDFLANTGVETIDALGQTFDPNLHEALAQEESQEVPEGKVLRQIRRGYRLRDRLLRPANVVVSKGVPHQVAASQERE